MNGRQTSSPDAPKGAGPQGTMRAALQAGPHLGDFLRDSVLHTTDMTFILRRRTGILLTLEEESALIIKSFLSNFLLGL